MQTTLSTLVPQSFTRRPERLGVPADRPELHGQVEGLVDGLASALKELHSVDLSNVEIATQADAGEQAWSLLEHDIRLAIEADTVDVASLPDPYSRYEAAALFAIWADGKPDPADVVLCHGNPVLSAFYFDGPDFVGVDDIGTIQLGDRHLDLAIVQHEIHTKLGPEAVFRFYDVYGDDPSLLRLDHYLLASFLRP